MVVIGVGEGRGAEVAGALPPTVLLKAGGV